MNTNANDQSLGTENGALWGRRGCAVLLLLLWAMRLDASIVLTIDPSSKTLSFSGMETVTPVPHDASSIPTVQWRLGPTPTGPIAIESVINTGMETSIPLRGGGPPVVNLLSSSAGTAIHILYFFDSTATPVTFTGNGTPVSYATVDPFYHPFLESLDSVSLAYGVGGSDMQVSVVPEPSTYVAGVLLLLPFGLSCLHRKRRQWGQL